MQPALLPVDGPEDILPCWRGTPVAELLSYHNLGLRHRPYSRAVILVGTCMDYRLALRLPERFAFVLRTGGANLRPVEFQIAFAIAAAGVRTVALIGHDDCRMAGLGGQREAFRAGLAEVGWEPEDALHYFDREAPAFDVLDPARFTALEADRLQRRFPGAVFAPLLYTVGDGRLHQLAWG